MARISQPGHGCSLFRTNTVFLCHRHIWENGEWFHATAVEKISLFFLCLLISPFHCSRQMGIHTNSLGVWGSCKRWSLGKEVHWAGCWHVDLVVVTRLHFQRCWLGRKPGLFFSQGDIRGHTLILGQSSSHGCWGQEALHNKHSHLPFHGWLLTQSSLKWQQILRSETSKMISLNVV